MSTTVRIQTPKTTASKAKAARKAKRVLRLHNAAMRCGLIAAVAYHHHLRLGDYAVSIVNGQSMFDSTILNNFQDELDTPEGLYSDSDGIAMVFCAAGDSARIPFMRYSEAMLVDASDQAGEFDSLEGHWRLQRMTEQYCTVRFSSVWDIEEKYAFGIKAIADYLFSEGKILDAQAQEIMDSFYGTNATR